MLPALAFVPSEDVVNAFHQLSTPNFLPDAQEFLDYFEDTWIGSIRRGAHREPQFPISLWNCREATLHGEPRTTNSVEGWHRGIRSLFGSAHPSLWKFIDTLKKEQSLVEARIEKLRAGQKESTPKKRYKDAASRLQQLSALYDNDFLNDFLVGIAHNLSF